MEQSLPEFFETTIEKLITGGAGLGHCEKLAAFIPLTAPGDRVRARIVRRKKGFVEAEAVEVLAPSPERVAPSCPHFGACGGCDLQQMTGDAQRRAKAAIVVECFKRLGGLDVSGLVGGPEPAGPETGYRNRIRLHAEPNGRYGLLRRGGQQVVPIDTCLQMPAVFTETILPWLRTMPPCQQILVRLDGRGGFLASLFGLPQRLRLLKQILRQRPEGQPPAPGCLGLLYNNLPQWGRDHLLVQAAGKTYRVSANCFFQSNYAEAEAVVATLRVWLDESGSVSGGPSGTLCDLYCGVGLFTLALGDRFDRVVAVESEAHAVRDARNNAEHDKTASGKVEVIEGDVAAVLRRWARDADGGAATASTKGDDAGATAAPAIDWPRATVVVDPPRAGLDDDVTALLARLAPPHIFYLSCDPATQARDAAALVKAGYALSHLRVFDMFPQTGHVEALLHLSRG